MQQKGDDRETSKIFLFKLTVQIDHCYNHIFDIIIDEAFYYDTN